MKMKRKLTKIIAPLQGKLWKTANSKTRSVPSVVSTDKTVLSALGDKAK